MISVLLVDDQQLIRSGIVSLLSLTPHIRVTEEATNGKQALDILQSKTFDIVLLDIQMPVMDGISAAANINQRYPDLPIIILTTFDDKSQVNAAVMAGAKGYLLKDASLEDVVAAIDKVIAGETLIEPFAKHSVSANLATAKPPLQHVQLVDELSKKELEVLRLMSAGFSNQEIADTLFRSTGTIKNQVSSILAKLGTRDRTRAVIKALEMKLI